MVRVTKSPQPDEDESDLPDGTEHVIVARRSKGVTAHAPRGYDGETNRWGKITYEYGDEVPEDIAENTWSVLGEVSESYVAVDEDGEVVYSPDEMGENDVEMLIQKWEANGFKPGDYTTRYYREQGGKGGASE